MRQETDGVLVLEESDLSRIPVRQKRANKGTYGPLLCIAGSEGMAGAAYLSALAAYRSGAGLVRICRKPSSKVMIWRRNPSVRRIRERRFWYSKGAALRSQRKKVRR